jgi:hypothetical protein
MQWTSAAIMAAGRGLSAEQRSTLQRVAAHPAREEFSRAAHAKSADVYGALLKLPLKEPIPTWSFPTIGLGAVGEAAESHAALVALDVADHRAADAERHAREIIAIGALMLDLQYIWNTQTAIDVLQRGIESLEAVYVATGREREARQLLDSVVTGPSRLRGSRAVFGGASSLPSTMRDTMVPRAVRMHAAEALLSRSCADPNQLLFGVDDSHRKVAAYARDSLARFPSERIYVDGLEGILGTGYDIPADVDAGVPMAMARMVDAVVGGKRFEMCMLMARLR